MILQSQDDNLYQCGGCRALAIALHDLTGWPLVVVSDYDEHDPLDDEQRARGLIAPARMSPAALHALVLHPDGSLIDSRGANDPAGVVEAYDGAAEYGEAVLRYAARADLLEEHECTDYAEYTVTFAGEHARVVFNHLSKEDSHVHQSQA